MSGMSDETISRLNSHLRQVTLTQDAASTNLSSYDGASGCRVFLIDAFLRGQLQTQIVLRSFALTAMRYTDHLVYIIFSQKIRKATIVLIISGVVFLYKSYRKQLNATYFNPPVIHDLLSA